MLNLILIAHLLCGVLAYGFLYPFALQMFTKTEARILCPLYCLTLGYVAAAEVVAILIFKPGAIKYFRLW